MSVRGMLYNICTMTASLWYRLEQGIQATFTKNRIASMICIKSTSLYTHHGCTTGGDRKGAAMGDVVCG